MITGAVSDGPAGFEHHIFKCLKCAHTDRLVLASDPLKSDNGLDQQRTAAAQIVTQG
jgi:hypothetical protein